MTTDLTALTRDQENRLRARFRVAAGPELLVTSGWHKLVLLTGDRAFAFPRGADRVHMIEREAAVLDAVDLPLAPRLFGLHRDEQIWPYPFLEMARLPGRSWDSVSGSMSFEQATSCLEQLARAAARWHRTPVPAWLTARPSHVGGGPDEPASSHPRLTDRWTGPDGAHALAQQAAALLSGTLTPGGTPVPDPAPWASAMVPVLSMTPATVHGELSDGQFLVSDQRTLTGVVDWDGLHRGHPLLDLDWGVGCWRILYEPTRFTELRRRVWAAYASERGIGAPGWPQVNLLWCLLDALALADRPDHELWPAIRAELSAISRHLYRPGQAQRA